MHISSEQMTALTAQRQGRFLERLAAFIQGRTRRLPDRRALDLLFARAMDYGLVTERQVAGYVTLAWASGAHEDAVDPAWMVEVMNDRFRIADDKIRALFDRADRFPRSRA